VGWRGRVPPGSSSCELVVRLGKVFIVVCFVVQNELLLPSLAARRLLST